jgi:hypothetical protein
LDIGAHQTLLFQNLTDNLLQTILPTIYILISAEIYMFYTCSADLHGFPGPLPGVHRGPHSVASLKSGFWLALRFSTTSAALIWRLLSEIEAPKNCIKKKIDGSP